MAAKRTVWLTLFLVCTLLAKQANAQACTNGDIRIRDGPSSTEGRPELCKGGVYYQICDDQWSQNDARVICNMLGYSIYGAQAYGLSKYGSGGIAIDGTAYLCDGTEDSLGACDATDANNCGTGNVAGVKCNSPGPCEAAGHTDCCISGCNTGSCYCDSDCYGFGDCCSDILNTCPQGNPGTACTTGEVRLVDGFYGNFSDGRVEFCVSGLWTSICNSDSSWDSLDSIVACSQSGYTQDQPIVYTNPIPYGQGYDGITATGFECTGDEASLSLCTYTSTGVDCGHQFDVGVDCNAGCTNGDTMITSGDITTGGYVLLCVNGNWEYISATGWGNEEAQVLCGEQGYSTLVYHAYGGNTYGTPKKAPTVTNFNCLGTEAQLSQCGYNTTDAGDTDNVAGILCQTKGTCESNGHTGCCLFSCNTGSCYCDSSCHFFGDCCYDDIDLTCPDSNECTEGDLRLNSTDSDSEGRVEVCINGKFGALCDDNWDDKEATVVCRQLGYETDGATAVVDSYFEASNLQLVAGNFACLGNEEQLTFCTYSSAGCGHHNEAGVRCPESCNIAGSLRLVGGDDSYEGRVESCQNGVWSSICQDSWSLEDATVVCTQLGYSTLSVHAYGLAYFGEGIGNIAASDIACDGSENYLYECTNSTDHTCDHSSDVGVDCSGPVGTCQAAGFSECCVSGCNTGSCYCDSSCYNFGDCCYDDIAITCPQGGGTECTENDVRISGGSNTNQGLVEICVGGIWTSVCDEDWDINDAKVACTQSGFPSNGAIAITGAYFGQDGGPIVNGGYGCTGSETSLSNCTYDSNPQCSKHQSAGVVCPEYCDGEGSVRLVGDELSGHVEVCSNGAWSAFCDTNWCEQNAKVVCGQLGYSTNRAEAYGSSYFGQEVASIQFDNVTCTGLEASITECTNSTNVSPYCGAQRLAGVRCFEKSPCEDAGFTECCGGSCNVGGCYCDQACHGFGDCCANIDNICPLSSTCVNGNVRLIDGVDNFEGRVEVCVNGKWGTVCDDSWDIEDATATCRQLGLSTDNVIVYGSGYFGQGDNPVVASKYQCSSGDELADCSFDDNFCCGHHRDAGVRCTPGCEDGDIILTDGADDYEGTVKVCINGQYQVICDDDWSTYDAQVVCRQLGYSTLNAHAYGKSFFGNGTGSLIGLTSVLCSGSEDSWVGCDYSEEPTCTVDQLAGVRCSGDVGACEADGNSGCCIFSCNAGGCYCDAVCHIFNDCCDDISNTCPQSNCTEGETRIVNNISADEFSGRVEICVNGQWGAICDDGWGLNEATIVCAQFGYTKYGSVPAIGAAFGQSSFSVVAANFSCNGLESNITSCSYTATSNCGHHEDAGVYCNVKCTDGDVRLANGTDQYEGRVEVCSNATWHTVCQNGWSNEDAEVTCRNLGFTAINAQAFGQSLFGAGFVDIMYEEFTCSGNESSLSACPNNSMPTCGSDQVAGVRCQGDVSQCEAAGHTGCCNSGCFAGNCFCDAVCHVFNDCCDNIDHTCPDTVCTDGDVRIVDGSNEFRGRVETCIDGQWGTICDDGWDNNDATVVCFQLGYSPLGARAVSSANFGQGSYDIVAGQFSCTGTESILTSCNYTAGQNCGHHQDAGVICGEKCDELAGDFLRLQGGETEYEGRIEVCLYGQWSSVCADDVLCGIAAGVACQQLGFSKYHAELYGFAKYGEGGGFVGVEGVTCLGTETNITECQYTLGSSCTHEMDAGVICKPISPCELAGHTGCCTSGCFNSQYSCWCDSFCHFFLDCCDDIESLCPSDQCTDGEVQFVSGNDTSGILQVCQDDRWNTVCDKGFGDEEAKIICKNHGLKETDFTIHDVTVYGQGDGDVYAKKFECTGEESSLADCPGDSDCCGHQRDIGLTCALACEEGDIRLADGDNDMEGRVEVCYNGRWGTVCDDLWDVSDARVACKMAGLPWRGAAATSFASFGQGIGPIHLDNVQCTGNEDTLWNCTAIVSNHNCAHFEDAGVTCANGPCELAGYTNQCCDISDGTDCQGDQHPDVCHCDTECELHGDCCSDFDLTCICTNGDVRLINGADTNEGRVEICLNGRYGTVCDDFFGTVDAQVVCRQLNLPDTSAEVFSFAYFGQGTGPIQLDNVGCNGDENYLINCSNLGIGIHNCVHFEDVGVRCNSPSCTNGETRLADGPDQYTGRLEVCYNGQWGTVCDDLFGQEEAYVACRSAGLPDANAGLIYFAFLYFGFASGPINLDNIVCQGTEDHLFNCSYTADHDCSHFEDIGIVCNPPCEYDGQLRLVGGDSNMEGRVEVCTGGTWGSVCDDSFDNSDAKVVCRQLGFSTGSPRTYINLQYGRGFGDVKYSELDCIGNETHLINCTKLTSGFFCSHFEDVGVGCEPGCEDGQLKLVDGDVVTEGRLEICSNGMWGTVCDDTASWGIHEARVVCQQLGFPTTAAQGAYYGAGGDPIHFSNFVCDGTELTLASCGKSTMPTCSHIQDVGVSCQEACTSGEVRLLDGTDQTNGRLEICIGGLWGTVCDEEFGNDDARVVCKQLGLEYAGAEAKVDAHFGEGDDDVALTTLHCVGNENTLFECFFKTGSAVDCSHANDAGVVCQGLCTNGDIRLVDGDVVQENVPPNSGRVEVCFNGEWGSVCDNGWSTNDANVVCTQAGFQSSPARAFGGYKYGAGIGNIYFTDVQCVGTETHLVNCPYITDTSECDHSEDAGVRCDGDIIIPTSTSAGTGTVTSTSGTASVAPTGTPLFPPPDPVQNVTRTIIDFATVEITWAAPDVTNGIIVRYNFVVIGHDELNKELLGNDPLDITLTTLEPGVHYSYYITVSNFHATSAKYTDSFFTAETTPIQYPEDSITATRLTGTTINVQWVSLSLHDAGGYVQGYDIAWAVSGTTSINKTTLSPDTTEYTIDQYVYVENAYNIKVRASTSVGYGMYSKVVLVNTTSSVFFQVKLFLLKNQKCGVWLENPATKLQDLLTEIVKQINSRCNCGLTTTYLYNAHFECNPSQDEEVHLRGQLFAPNNAIAASGLASNITDWVNDNPKVNVEGVNFEVDTNCDVVIEDYDDPYCKTPSSVSAALVVGVSVSITVIIIVIIVIAVLAITIVFLVRRSQVKYQSGGGYGDASHEMVGYSNRIAFPEGQEDNISQRMGSTVHDDDFDQAINMISDDIDRQNGGDIEKAKLSQMDEFGGDDEGRVYFTKP